MRSRARSRRRSSTTRCHITTVYMPLVRTPMIAPTGIYDAFPTASPDEAADLIAQAMITKPKKVATRLGTFGEVLYALAPKSVDVILNTAYKLFPESAAAKGEKKKDAEPSDRGRRVRAPDARSALVVRTPQRRPQAQASGAGATRTSSPRRRSCATAAEGIRAHLGFGDERRRAAGSARGRRAAGAAARAARAARGDLHDATRTSARRTPTARSYRDIVRAFRGRFDHVPRRRRVPARRARGRRAARLVRRARAPRRSRTAAARASSAASRRAVGDGYAGAVTIDLRRLDRVLEVDRDVARGADPGRRDRARRSRTSCASTASRCATSRSRSSSRRSAAGSPRARAVTSRRSTRTSTTWWSRSRRSRPRGVIETRRLPGSGAGPSPDRMLLGSEGILGVITEAWVRVQDRPVLQGLGRRALRGLRGRRRGACARSRRAACFPTNCRLLDPREAEITGSRPPDGRALLVLGFESADHPVDAWMDRALELAADHGGAGAERRQAGDGRRRDGKDSVGAWRDAFLRAPYLRDTFVACGVISDTFETAITWDRFPAFHAAVMEAAAARGARGLRRRPRDVPVHARLSRRARALLHGARAGRAAARSSSSGTRSRPPPPRR